MTDTTNTRQDELEVIVATESMLTTIDNPYNPFTQYTLWYGFDVEHHYNTCAYLARIVKSSQELSEADEALAIDMAIDEILEYNLLGTHIKVTPATFKARMKAVRGLDLLKG